MATSIFTVEDPVSVAAEATVGGLASVGPRPRLAIAGGSALRAALKVREQAPEALWQRVRLTFVDERRVPHESLDSNFGSAQRMGVTQGAELVLPLFSPNSDLDATEQRLMEEFDCGLDVLLLGVGEDGHIASLFPGRLPSNADGGRRFVAGIDDSPKPPEKRVTMTLDLMRTARYRIVVMTGEAKREALSGIRSQDPTLPVNMLDHLNVFTDQTL